jgi:lysophospholipase
VSLEKRLVAEVGIAVGLKRILSDENGRKLAAVGVVGGSDMTVEGALTKLAYLLAKDLPVSDVRKLMTQSIRGELTPPAPFVTELAGSKHNRIASLFARLLLLSNRPSTLARDQQLDQVAGQSLSDKDLTAVEDSLNPLLVASAAAKPDASLETLLNTLLEGEPQFSNSDTQGLDLLNNFTTHSPLHIACLHGIVKNVQLLLQNGASVHLRDVSGHTALYYAVTSHHASKDERMTMVLALRSAGAHLSQHEKELSKPAAKHHHNDSQLWLAAGCV